MNCAVCNNPLSADARLCPVCGSVVPQRSTTIDFTDYMLARAQDFTGRRWVFDRIDAWQKDIGGSRFFILIGEPGAGKSALSAHLALTGNLSAYHFCIARQAATLDPLNFTEHLSYQLTHLDGFADCLLEEARIHLAVNIQVRNNYGHIIGVQINNLIVKAPSALEAFNRAIINPLAKYCARYPSQAILILIDGLDEADEYSRYIKISDLLSRADGLPAQVRFLITSRPDSIGLQQLEGISHTTVDLIKDEAEIFSDANRYIDEQIEKSQQLKDRLLNSPISVSAFKKKLQTKHQGNFRYLSLLFHAIEKGETWAGNLDQLPPNLDSIYREHLHTRALGKKSLWRAYRPILGVLAAAQEALTVDQIKLFSGVSSQKVTDVLQDAGQFLEKTGPYPPYYLLYHQSLADFLGDQSRADEYWIDLESVHHNIVKRYAKLLKSRNWAFCDRYGLDHLAYHLYQGNLSDQLYTLVNDDWKKARFLNDGYSYHGWLQDVSLAWQSAVRQDREFIKGKQLMQNVGIQIRCALSQASVYSLTQNTTPELLRRLVTEEIWELDRAIKLVDQIGDSKVQWRCLRALSDIETLTEQQKSILSALLHPYDEDVNENRTISTEQIPGYRFDVHSISDEGRARLEQLLEHQFKNEEDYQPFGAREKNPLLDLLKDELSPRDMEESKRRVWFYQRLNLIQSPHPDIVRRAQDDTSFALALAFGFTPALAERYIDKAIGKTLSIRSAAARTVALWALAPHINDRCEDRILNALKAMKESEPRLALIDRLSKYLSVAGIKRMLEFLSAIREDETGRMVLLGRLVPSLQKKAYQQTALQEALQLADSQAGSDSEIGTRVYANLVQYLSADQIEKTVSRSRGISYRKTASLARLLPFLPVDRQQELASEAVSAPLEYEMESYHGPAVVQLGYYLETEKLVNSMAFHSRATGKETQTILEQIRSANDLDERADASVQPNLRIALGYHKETFIDCIESLLPYIKTTHLPMALSLVEHHGDTWNQTFAWILLTTKMNADEKEPFLYRVKVNTLDKVHLLSATMIGMTAKYHPEWLKRHNEEYLSVMQALLQNASVQSRGATLKCIAEMLPALVVFSAPGIAEEVFCAVQDTCYKWDWS